MKCMTPKTIRFKLSGRRVAIVAGALALTLLIVAQAAAHDTWLISPTNSGRVGTPFRLDLTSGELFPNDDFAIEASRVSRAQVREGHFTRTLPTPTATPMTLRYMWVPKAPGVSTIGIELQPKVLTLAPKLIQEYLGEINADSSIRATWKSIGDNQKWTESYTKHAMTFARITPAKPDSNWVAEKAWSKPMGLGLELVPERDPTALRGGDTLSVRVLAHGVALAGFSVGAIREGRLKAEFFRTDTAGRAKVILDKGGQWLLNGTMLRRSTTGATVWESDFVTATLHVAPRP